MSAPKTPNTSLPATIIDLSHDGRGVAKIGGKTTFIWNALPDEQVEFVYKRRHNQWDEAVAVQILESSPKRLEPRCQHFAVCGGCSLQHLDSTSQLYYKQKWLLEQLTHIAGIQPKEILPPLTGESWHYRHKARLSIKYVQKKEKVVVGFRERNSHLIADLTECHTLHPAVGKKLVLLNELITKLQTRQNIPQIEIAISDNATAFVMRHLLPLPEHDLKELREFAIQHDIWLFLQPSGPNSVHLLWPENIAEPLLYYELPDEQLRLFFTPLDFTQVNPEINNRMINQSLQLLQLKPTDRVLDLFCGLGNFSLPIARRAQHVDGVEGEEKLVNRAGYNAAYNKITNATFYTADLSQDFSHHAWAQSSFDKIVLDPPRAGALTVVKNIQHFKASKILYISCYPATFARDAKELVAQGYQLTQLGIMDMFPHTSHVETMGVFEKL